jgi:hypothetical protein
MISLVVALLLCSVATAEDTALQDSQDSQQHRKSRESVDTAVMHSIVTGAAIPGNASVLIRDFRRGDVNATLNMAEGLGAGEAYTVWVIVFNNPARCIDPYACTGMDFEFNGGDPRVRVSAFQGGTFIPYATGGTFNIGFRKGRTAREGIPGFSDQGCTRLRECEIHLVTRTHGPADNAGVQLKGFLGGCDNGLCNDTMFAVHRSPNTPE